MGSAGAGDWALCGVALQLPERPVFERADDPEATHLTADDADMVEEGTSVFRGNVEIARGTRQIRADTVRVTRPERILDAEGNIRFWDEGVYLSGETAHVELETDYAEVEGAEYIYLESHAHGAAERVVFTNRDLIEISDASYTTCNPDDEVWTLNASEIKLDRISEFGTGRNVLVRFKGVPIFYSPYLTFPLSDKRKTGFLTPSYRVSGQTGFEFHLPYYWNIAPERDATLTARGMTRRGVLLQGEYRYLSHYGDGQLGLEYLPHDAVRGNDRAAFAFQHDGSFARDWRTDIDVDWASDKDYFEDLGTNLAIASRSFLERKRRSYLPAKPLVGPCARTGLSNHR